MNGLSFDIEGIYFNCFRKPMTTSAIITYSVPPFTTIRGLVANALGLPAFPLCKEKHIELQEKISIGLLPLRLSDPSAELTKVLKLKAKGKKRYFERLFPSSPMFKEFLVNPKYRVFIVGEEPLISKLYKKILNSERPLYLGKSDDFVDIQQIKFISDIELKKKKSNKIWGLVGGIQKGCEIIKLPYKFSDDGKSLEQILVSVPSKQPILLEKKVESHEFNGKNICLF